MISTDLNKFNGYLRVFALFSRYDKNLHKLDHPRWVLFGNDFEEIARARFAINDGLSEMLEITTISGIPMCSN